MNTRPALLALCITLLVPAAAASAAQSKDEQILLREAARLDRTAATPEGEKAVRLRLIRGFRLDEDRFTALRATGIGYGEIAIALSCARSLPGGASQENVDRLLTLRQGPPALGWGVVARQLGIKLGKCASQVKKVHNESRREIKKGHTAGAGRTDASPVAAPSPQHNQHEFTGEGKPMTRGTDAQ